MSAPPATRAPSSAPSTTIATAARLAGRPGRVVLLSGRAAGGLGARSLIASDPDVVLSGDAGDAAIRDPDGRVLERGGDPLALLESMVAGCEPGAVVVGYLGYDTGARLAGVDGAGGGGQRPAREPGVWLGRYRACAIIDASGTRVVSASAADAAALEARLAAGAELGPPPALGPLEPADDRAGYRAQFARVHDYLEAGDCYQVNLSRRLDAPVRAPGDPLALLAALDRASPEPFAALIETGEVAVISASPERFLHRAAGSDRLETRPIKGTRRRTGDRGIDERLRAELAASDKERAEHLMIVDLERNDLGRVARTGSVAVDRFAAIVELPTLFHVESTVSCRVRPDVGLAEILGATFPGGSITGAPKRRAMEIIAELEPVARGVYTGAIGVFDGSGAIDLSIAIRTGVLCPKALTLHVGGGVVADSDVDRELEETEEKAEGWRRALVLASG